MGNWASVARSRYFVVKRNVYLKFLIQRHGFEYEFYFTSAVEIISIVFYHNGSYSNKIMKPCNNCLLNKDPRWSFWWRKNAMYSACTSNERLKTEASNDFILIGFCLGLIRTNKSQVSQNMDCFSWKYSERKNKIIILKLLIGTIYYLILFEIVHGNWFYCFVTTFGLFIMWYSFVPKALNFQTGNKIP